MNDAPHTRDETPAPPTKAAPTGDGPRDTTAPRRIRRREWLAWGVFGLAVSAAWIGAGAWLWGVVTG